MEYTIVIHPADEVGSGRKCHCFRDVILKVRLVEEVFRNIEEAIGTHVEALRGDRRDRLILILSFADSW
jgi:hypothetical protein